MTSKTHLLLSVLTLTLGIAFLIFMIVVEDELGAIPLGLIIIGSIWFGITSYKSRSERL